ncbi:PREDICTED: uncharacterized protein LOC108616502 [Drosophila arizonae]|uniref:Uncharacterized protein LOC108616502 n=1 Tax=Drosophila arizonae TaxID=7263 RepID=A0ABM1PJ40_DROAR|nr:PREDICTED: uncharacterized protein LOC108616502 [Drosophila arizonae]
MRQMLSAKRTELFIGLLAMGVAMLTTSLSEGYNEQIFKYLMIIARLQFVATCVLLFGILKAHQQHKDKCMLFWLLTTPCLFFGLIFYGMSRWYYRRILSSVITVSIYWLAAMAVLYMLIIMYNHYVALTLGTIEDVAAPPETEPTKEQLAKLNGQV